MFNGGLRDCWYSGTLRLLLTWLAMVWLRMPGRLQNAMSFPGGVWQYLEDHPSVGKSLTGVVPLPNGPNGLEMGNPNYFQVPGWSSKYGDLFTRTTHCKKNYQAFQQITVTDCTIQKNRRFTSGHPLSYPFWGIKLCKSMICFRHFPYNGVSSWWNFKYFECSSLFGEDSHFD